MQIVVRCSACGAPVASGATHCAACRLQLTAQAVPVAIQQRQSGISPLGWAIIGIVCAIVLGNIAEMIQRPAEERAEAAREAKSESIRLAQLKLVDSLSTPAAFAKRCGKPTKQYRGLSYSDGYEVDPKIAHNATTFIYSMQTDGVEMHVIFFKESDPQFAASEFFGDKRYLVKPYDALVDMGCVERGVNE